jgi:hypothetical protein
MPRRFVFSSGDVNWFDYGGGLVFRDGRDYELEVIIPPGGGLDHYEIYRVPLDSEVPSWLDDNDLQSIANTVDYPEGAARLREDFSSSNISHRTNAYEAAAAYHGWHNFDSYPLQLSRAEARKRYASLLRRKAKARYAV